MYKRNVQGWLKHIDFILLDAIVLQVAFVIAYAIRHGEIPYTNESYRTLAIMLFVVDILIAAIFNTMSNILKRGYYQEFIQTMKQVVLVMLIITLYLFSMHMGDIYSRITIFLTSVFHFVLGYCIHRAWRHVIRRLGKVATKAAMVLVADEKSVPEILTKVSATDNAEYSGIVLINRDGTGERMEGIPIVASLETVTDYLCREWVDEVFVYPAQLADIEVRSLPLNKSIEELIGDDRRGSADKEVENKPATVAALIESCRQMAIPVHIRLPISNLGERAFVEKVAGYDVLTAIINYASPMQLAFKRIMDIIGGLIGSIIAVIVIAVVAPLIKKDSPGPILYKQIRIGQNGKRFRMLKIRSMYMDADERKAELMNDNRVSDGMMFKLDWDPRIIGNKIVNGKQVTGIGEMIRTTSLDEFPQFFNILAGQMSLVGTRPPTEDEWEKYKYHHRARLATKPGLSGLWQVSGRSRITDFEEVVKLDTEYINHWSLGLDIRILIKTVKTVFTKDGAM